MTRRVASSEDAQKQFAQTSLMRSLHTSQVARSIDHNISTPTSFPGSRAVRWETLGTRLYQHNISQHCWPYICKFRVNDRNIWTQDVATLLGATCSAHWNTSLRRVGTENRTNAQGILSRKRRLDSENTRYVKKKGIRSNHWSFWTCFWGQLGRGEHMIIVSLSFSKAPLSKLFYTAFKRNDGVFQIFLSEERFLKVPN